MIRRSIKFLGAACVAVLLGFSSAATALAQDQTQDSSAVSSTPEQPGRPADGRRHADLSVEAYAVVPGTKFLVRLEDELDTKETHEKKRFKVTTLEPLEAGSGIYLPPGAEIRGHVSRVESAGITGRAKIWLTFDEIRTKFAILPIVAEVVSVPGDHSVKTGSAQQEGLIEGRTSTQQAAAEAAAAGAAIGAVKGVKDKNKKEVAEGAAAGAIAAYLTESGRGHEIDLPKGAKLELELERALYLLRE
jgi:phosphotransferase system  glucose/maltose/N-acetylglucosamine-specific IIC component